MPGSIAAPVKKKCSHKMLQTNWIILQNKIPSFPVCQSQLANLIQDGCQGQRDEGDSLVATYFYLNYGQLYFPARQNLLKPVRGGILMNHNLLHEKKSAKKSPKKDRFCEFFGVPFLSHHQKQSLVGRNMSRNLSFFFRFPFTYIWGICAKKFVSFGLRLV